MAVAERPVRLLLVQNPGTGLDPERTVDALVEMAERGLSEGPSDFVAFSEMATTAYFCGTNDRRYFEWAQTVPGPVTERFGELAQRHRVNVCIPLYEKGPNNGVYYNSAVFIDRNGDIIPGRLPDGTMVSCYRKNHISDNYSGNPGTNEKFFFRPGPGFPVFATDAGTVSALICYDRSFPESWRMLALHGVELIFVVAAIALKHRAAEWALELRASAVQNGVFVAAVNKAGPETVEATRTFSGRSLVIDPFGTVLAEAPEELEALVREVIDLRRVEEHSQRYHYLRDRRPEIYPTLTRVTHV